MFSVFAIGCDKSPFGPSLRVAHLTISGVGALRTSLSTDYTVTATLRDGTSRPVTPTWTSTNPDVASVDSDGRLHGRAHGSTSLTAFYEGRIASKTVHVVNNYEGSWTGVYVIRACDQTGYFVAWEPCERSGRVGQVLPIELVLSQIGNTQSEIRGTLVLDPFPHLPDLVRRISQSITGVVTADGRLSVSGSSNINGWDEFFTLQVTGWDTNLSSPGVMTGRWTQNLTVSYFGGHSYQENELVTMTGGSGESFQSAR
jgi:hypothetical protein